MQPHRRQPLRVRVERALNHVCREHVFRVRIRIAEEVGQTDGREGVIVGVGAGVEFDHRGNPTADMEGIIT